MIIVIADNLIVATEIAGIGHAYGLSSALLTEVTENLPVCDLIVIASDTRTMTESEAVNETHAICQQIKAALPKLTEARHAAMTPLQRAQAMAHPNEVLHIYKATDALLRGHVHLELRALVEESRYEQVMYLPANPSRKQIVRGGRYFLDGAPIEQGSVKNDPDFPIVTANVADAIGVRPGSRLRICDAEDAQDVQRVARLALNNHTPTLLAGSTDLFCAMLTELGHKPTRHKQFPGLSDKGAALIVCGSPNSQNLNDRPYVRRHEMSISAIPHEIFEAVASLSINVKEATDRWMGRIKQMQLVNGKTASYVLTIPYPSAKTRAAAQSLCQVTAEMTHRLYAQTSPVEIIIEGGDTAYAAVRKLGWARFQVTQQVAPGIVRLHCLDATHTHLTIKSGTCDWNDLLN